MIYRTQHSNSMDLDSIPREDLEKEINRLKSELDKRNKLIEIDSERETNIISLQRYFNDGNILIYDLFGFSNNKLRFIKPRWDYNHNLKNFRFGGLQQVTKTICNILQINYEECTTKGKFINLSKKHQTFENLTTNLTNVLNCELKLHTIDRIYEW